MSLAAAPLWHKPSANAVWMHRFIILSDSTIRIYASRKDHERHLEPLYTIELLTTTHLLPGTDNIIFQGWLTKKGKFKWNPRWCALLKYGYLNYVDPAQKQEIRSIDVSDVQFILEKNHNLFVYIFLHILSCTVTHKLYRIQWKNDKGEWFQFRCNSESEQKNWHKQMTECQKDCMQIRLENEKRKSFNKEPTLFAFSVSKSLNTKEVEQHCFCAPNELYCNHWMKCITEQIAYSENIATRSRKQSDFLRQKLQESKSRKRKIRKETAAANAIGGFRKLTEVKEESESDNDEDIMSDAEIEEKMKELMDQLKIPQNARSKMMSLGKVQKIEMLSQHALKEKSKQKESGKEWAARFASYKQTNMSVLQQFSVVLRDENDIFLKDFIESLGLTHICRLAVETSKSSSSKRRGKGYSTGFDIELLRVMKAIIDSNQYSLRALVEHKLAIRIIVEKIDSADIKISELSLSLLVTMVGIENDAISISAANKILASLKDLASSQGHRNKFKVLISHMSVKDVLRGSFQYDTYAVTLINYMIMSLQEISSRMEERRLLSSLSFDKILNKLEDRIKRRSVASNSAYDTLSDALLNQIETYRNLYETDKRNANDFDADNDGGDVSFDVDNPKDLFQRVHDQALQDGYINELVSILKNLVVLPRNAESAWYNVSKIVNVACKPAQKEVMQKTADAFKNKFKNLNAVRMSVWGGGNNNKYVSEITQYPTYEELHHLLQIRDAQSGNMSNDPISRKQDALKAELDECREKLLTFEEALFEEKSKSASFQLELQNLKKYGTSATTIETVDGTPSILRTRSTAIDDQKKQSEQSKETEEKVNNAEPVPAEEAKPKPKMQNAQNALLAALQKNKKKDDAIDDNKSAESPAAQPQVPTTPIDDGYAKYRKMIKFKMPKASIVNRMRQDGIDKAVIEQYVESEILPGGNAVASSSKTSNTVSETKSPPTATKQAAAATKLSAEDEAKLSKYKRMKKINMPQQSIINRMRQDGISPHLIGAMFPNSVESGGSKSSASAIKKKAKKEKPKLPPNLKPKKVIKPNAKMKNLHWTKVNPFDVEKTIWNKIDDESIKMNVKDLEQQFCWKAIVKKDNNTQQNKSSKSNETVRVLDTRRAYNIEIFLGRLKMDPWTLREALLSLNENKLNLDTIHKLINFVPTKEESDSLNGYENEKNLGSAEKFVKIIRNVDTNLSQRLVVWEFKIEFEELYKREKESLYFLRKGHDSIRKSKALKLMFTLILSIGNHMNGGTNKGQAYGFKLSSLSQLMRSRTVDNTQCLMEYIYSFVSSNDSFKECMNFVKDLQCLEEATQIDIAILRANIAAIGNKLRIIKNRIEDKKTIKRMGDEFVPKMKPFYSQSIVKFEKLQKLKEGMFVDLKNLGIWLNESNDANFKYLKNLNQFRLDFIASMKSVKQKKQKLLEIEKRKKWKEERAKNKSKAKRVKPAKKNKKPQMLQVVSDENEMEPEMTPDLPDIDMDAADSNISDFVIQSLAEVSPADFLHRLQSRAQSISKTNSFIQSIPKQKSVSKQ